ncbi:MAG TPA: glycoside hydrolase [Lentisphaeria bacterium]|nr:MAG: glycoside hydrolase [Lentisphaerae bacterium GWF2_49_21]HBC89199.1 glycoside hydrolase [Lentisphaeria bacterium]
MKHFGDGRDWFFENRYGMFIHWGLYSIDGWHEQVQWRRRIPKAEYVKRVAKFNPVKYDPDEWMRLAKESGMDYVIFTTKHHDGFCMWDTKETDYNIMRTPYGKDVLAMLAKSCRKYGIKLCLYYSCPDWHHPNSINHGGDHELLKQNPGDEPDIRKYISFVKRQATELCSNYGKIYGFFWDIPPRVKDPSINRLLRKLQPGIMINDRGYDKGDYDTPERKVPAGGEFSRPTEACQSVGDQSWGYREGEDYYTRRFLMQSIAKIMSMGGNYVLNVGPKPDGTIPKEASAILKDIGKWYRRVKPAITAESSSKYLDHENFMLTRDGNKLYVVCHKDLPTSGIVLSPIGIMPKSAILLNNGKRLTVKLEVTPKHYRSRPFIHIQGIPVEKLIDEPLVIKLEFKALSDKMLSEMSARAKNKEYIF